MKVVSTWPKADGLMTKNKDILLNSKDNNYLMSAFFQEEYRNVHTFNGAKQILDTLVITYERSSEVKRNKLSLLNR